MYIIKIRYIPVASKIITILFVIYFIDKTFLLVMSGEVEIIVKRDIYLQEIVIIVPRVWQTCSQ